MKKVGRNEPCPCGSGKKHKKCCIELVGKTERMPTTLNEYADQVVSPKKNDHPDKGEKNGHCNRGACQSPDDVIFFNYSTRKYYCFGCAERINQANKDDAIRLFGHELCLTDDKLTPLEWARRSI